MTKEAGETMRRRADEWLELQTRKSLPDKVCFDIGIDDIPAHAFLFCASDAGLVQWYSNVAVWFISREVTGFHPDVCARTRFAQNLIQIYNYHGLAERAKDAIVEFVSRVVFRAPQEFFGFLPVACARLAKAGDNRSCHERDILCAYARHVDSDDCFDRAAIATALVQHGVADRIPFFAIRTVLTFFDVAGVSRRENLAAVRAIMKLGNTADSAFHRLGTDLAPFLDQATVGKMLTDEADDWVPVSPAQRLANRHAFRYLLTTICMSLQELDLPALQTLLIIDELLPNQYTMHFKWRAITKVKHFRTQR